MVRSTRSEGVTSRKLGYDTHTVKHIILHISRTTGISNFNNQLTLIFILNLKPMQYRNEDQEAECLEWISDVLAQKLPTKP